MSGREWKPGDVALVRNEWNVWNVAICTLRADHLGWWWRYGVADDWSPIANPDVRPLVVIDPEDRKQVDRLCKALVEKMHAAGDVASAANGVHPATVALALREFADPKPPKPEEPTGLGAVVEDQYGDYWVYTGLRDDDDERWFFHGPNKGKYRNINAVRVLSEGVQPGESA